MRLQTSILSAGVIVLLAAVSLGATGAIAPQVAQAPEDQTPPAVSTPSPTGQPRQLGTANKPWTGDFDQMLERRMIRVLVPYSRTLFFNDKGHERGITAELVRHWEQYINKKYRAKLGKRPITVYLIPTTRDKLIPQVAGGLGDIAAGNITVTEARLATVDFVAPEDMKPVNEIVVAGPKAPPHQDRRRPLRRDRARPQVQQLLRESADAERALHQGAQAAGEARAAARRARGRGRHGDGQRGHPGHPDRRRLEGHDLGAGPAADQGHPRRGGPHGGPRRAGSSARTAPSSPPS